jgi:hypothetical protein
MAVNMASLPSTVTVVTGAGCIFGAAGSCWLLAASGSDNVAHKKIAAMDRIFLIRLFANSSGLFCLLPQRAKKLRKDFN